MEEILRLFGEVGVPTWILGVLFVAYAIVKEVRFFAPRRKSERELLSADELTFRQGLMDRIKAQGLEIQTLHSDLAACHLRHAELANQLNDAVFALRSAGLKFLTQISPSDPLMIDPTTPGNQHS